MKLLIYLQALLSCLGAFFKSSAKNSEKNGRENTATKKQYTHLHTRTHTHTNTHTDEHRRTPHTHTYMHENKTQDRLFRHSGHRQRHWAHAELPLRHKFRQADGVSLWGKKVLWNSVLVLSCICRRLSPLDVFGPVVHCLELSELCCLEWGCHSNIIIPTTVHNNV